MHDTSSVKWPKFILIFIDFDVTIKLIILHAVILLYFSSILLCVASFLGVINFPLSTIFIMFHNFMYEVYSFSLFSALHN